MSVIGLNTDFQHDPLSGYIILKYLKNTSEVSVKQLGLWIEMQDGSTYTELITVNSFDKF